MARIRTIKPSFWSDPAIAGLRRDVRLMVVGLISMADDQGRFLASPSAIAGFVFPHDRLPANTIRRWLDDIAQAGVIELYCADGLEFGHFPKWTKHQRVSKPYPSQIPAPPGPFHERNGSHP